MVDAIFRVDTHAACGTSGRMKIILRSALTLALSQRERGIVRKGEGIFRVDAIFRAKIKEE